MSIATPYINASTAAAKPDSLFWLEKGKSGRTTVEDIQDALQEYERNYHAGNSSKAEILTLHRAFPDSPTYKKAATEIQKMDMVDPMVIGGPASIEMIDREGHLITTNALNRAFQKFMSNQRTRNVMVLHSDVQVGWALPAYISKGGQIFKSGVGENGLFFICELRDDTAISKKVADQINNGLLKSYSIAGSATKIQNMKKGLTPYMQVDEMELAEVTVCEKGVNQGASFEILKAEMPQTGKVDKDQCGYRDATAPEMNLGINCGHCKYFNSDTRTCDVVVGDIMPGDYCQLFEAGEKDSPQIQVHRKIVIMRSDNTGKINFEKSFTNWMAKEADPLKSGKSFPTLDNFEGRDAEHHRFLQEYGFPSEPDIETMRYIPVVETETDDGGIPIHVKPPWVVNESGQDLGDKLDGELKKSLEIFYNVLQKRESRPRRPLDKAPFYSNPPTNVTPQEPPKPPGSENPEPNQPTPPNIPTANVGASTSTAPPSYVPQQPMTEREQRGKEFGEMREGAEKPLGRLQRIFRQGRGSKPDTESSESPSTRRADPSYVPQQPMTEREQRGQEFGEMRRGAKQPWGQIQRAFKAGKRGAGRSLDRQADRLGRGISTLDRGRKNVAGGFTDALSGASEGYQSGYEASEEGRKKVGRLTGDKIRQRDMGDVASGDRKPTAARNLGRLFGAGSRAGQSIAGRTAAAGARQVGRTGRGAYRAGMGTARGLAGAKGEDQPRSQFGFNEEGKQERDRERSGGVGGTGKAGYAVGRGIREFGRGLGRGSLPREELSRQEAAGKKGWESRGARAGGRESTAERMGRLLGSGARGVARQPGNVASGLGDAGKAGMAEVKRVQGERRDTKAAELQTQQQTQQRAERKQARLNRSLEGERIGEGSGNFRPSHHEGMTGSARHDDVSGHLSDIGNGYNLSPKDWMTAIHHLTQNSEGQRFAHFKDVDIPGDKWHGNANRIGAGDMRKHIQRMMDNGQISFGEHGGEGQRALDSIMGKLENSHTNKEQMTMKRLSEKRTTGLDEDDAPPREQQQQQEERQERQTRTTDDKESGSPDELMARERNRQQREREVEDDRRRQGYGPNPMDLDWDTEKAPVHKVFAKAFGLTKTRR